MTYLSKQPVFIKRSEVINAAGRGLDDVVKALERGKSCLDVCGKMGLVGHLQESTLKDLEQLRHAQHLKDYDMATLLAVMASRTLRDSIVDAQGCAVIVGSSRGNTQSFETQHEAFVQKKELALATSPRTTMGSFSAAVARDLELGGLQTAVSSACSTSLQAVILGAALLRADLANSVVAGGAEVATTAFTLAMLRRIRIYHRGLEAYIPFSSARSGMVLGDGAAVHHLTTVSDGATGQIMGVGSCSERSTLTGVSQNGSALVAAIGKACADADIEPKEIAAIVGHGAGTRRGDAAELAAYQQIFGNEIPPLTCDKWCFGHTLGAASATSLAVALHISKSGKVLPSPHQKDSDQDCGSVPVKQGGKILVAALGFGGGAAAAIVRSRL